MNDPPLCFFNLSLFLIANDTKCFKGIGCSCDRDQLQSGLDFAVDWSNTKNSFLINPSWSSLLLDLNQFNCLLGPTRYFIGSFEIKSGEYHPDLAVIVCNDLFWSHHYHHLCNNAYETLSLHFHCSISKQTTT